MGRRRMVAIAAACVVLCTGVAVRASAPSIASVGLAVDGGQALVPSGGRFVVRVAPGAPGEVTVRYRKSGREAVFPDGQFLTAGAGEVARTLTAPAVAGRYDLPRRAAQWHQPDRADTRRRAARHRACAAAGRPVRRPRPRALPPAVPERLLHRRVARDGHRPAGQPQRPVDAAQYRRQAGGDPRSGTATTAGRRAPRCCTRVPGLDLPATWGTTGLPAEQRDHITNVARYLAPDAPIVIVEHPHRRAASVLVGDGHAPRHHRCPAGC